MSEEHVEIARKGYEAFNRGDLEGWLETIHPDAELILPFYQALEGGGAARGRAGAKQIWDSWRAAFPDASFEPKTIRDLGETTFVALRVRGRGGGSDVPIDQPSWHLIEWRDRKVIRMQAFLREAEALEAAGLSG